MVNASGVANLYRSQRRTSYHISFPWCATKIWHLDRVNFPTQNKSCIWTILIPFINDVILSYRWTFISVLRRGFTFYHMTRFIGLQLIYKFLFYLKVELEVILERRQILGSGRSHFNCCTYVRFFNRLGKRKFWKFSKVS